MKLKTLLLSTGLALAMTTSGQNQGWTATDINGVDHTIQDYLDQGMTVLVDISAHWCGPCWAWHNSEIMQKLWNEFGPDGTGDLMIIWVDGDPASNMTLLNGGAGSQGDWVTGTPFPIIGPSGEGNVLANLYNISYYPTLFMHCPGSSAGIEIDRENTWQQFLNSWKSQCPGPFNNGVNDATLFAIENGELCPGEHPFIDLYNQGSATLSSATLKLKQGTTVIETVNWTGSLAPFQLTDVEFPSTTVSGPVSYTVEVSDPNGSVDANPAGDTQDADYDDVPQAPTTLVTLELKTDNYGSETTWKLFNGAGAVVAQDPPGNYANNMVYTYTWGLNTNDCYTFAIYDTYGDGICCTYGTGYYKLKQTFGAGTVFIQGGEFGAEEEKGFGTSGAVGVIENGLAATLAIYPNPTNGNVTVSFGTAAKADLDVFNVLGERVMGLQLTGPQADVSLSELSNGIYYFNLTADGATTTLKVTVNK